MKALVAALLMLGALAAPAQSYQPDETLADTTL